MHFSCLFPKYLILLCLFAYIPLGNNQERSESRLPESRLPDMGTSASRVLSLTEEQALGYQFMLQIRQALPLEEDPLALDYIKHLGFKLVEHNPDAKNRQFYFYLVKHNSINAFAIPGGYIGTHTGLIAAAETESEVAAVLGHEIAHVTQRHIARRLENQKQLSLPSLVGVLGSILVAAKNPQTGIGLLATTQGLAQQVMLNHSRAHEKEADRIGIQTLSSAGFDTDAMAGFFIKMQMASRYSRRPPEFLLTHPITQRRIADARARAKSLPNKKAKNSLSFLLIQARIMALDEAIKSAEYLKNKELYKKSLLNDPVKRYMYALQCRKNNAFKTSIDILVQLHQQQPHNIIYLTSLAESYTESNQPEKAIPLLEAELKNTPTSYPLIMAYVDALLTNKQPLAARSILLEHAFHDDAEPNMLKILAKAQKEAGFENEVHETTGQYLFLMGDLQGALAQFTLALENKSNDPYANSRVRARIQRTKKIILDSRNRG